jgi:hypothetical protein
MRNAAANSTIIFGAGGGVSANILLSQVGANGNVTVKVGESIVTPGVFGLFSTGIIAAEGDIVSNAVITATGNVIGGNLRTAGLITASGNVTGGNVLTGGLVSATGTVTGSSLLGSVISASGNVTGGNILTGGLISATGNISGGNANINGNLNVTSSLTVSSNGTYGNVVTTQFASLYASGAGANPYSIVQVRSNDGISGMGMQAYANINSLLYANTGITFQTGATLRDKDYPTGGATRVTIDSTGLSANGIVSASGNVTGGNVLTAGQVSATGNVTGNYILGNGAFLSGVITSVANINNGTSNVAIPVANGNVQISVGGTANVAVFATTGEYITGLLSASGNVTGGNILTGGIVSAAGNISGLGILSDNYYYANGTPRSFGIVYTASTTPPSSPSVGDQWYNTSTDILYEYTYDGTTNYWVDIVSPAFAAGVVANIAISGSMLVNANAVYDIGSASQTFANVYAQNYFGNGSQLTGLITSVANINNGTSNVTVVSSGGNITTSIAGNSNVVVVSSGAMTIKGNVLPSANITYNLGSSTQRWNDLWLANSTIYIGNSQISANATSLILTNPAGGQTVLAGASAGVTGATVSASGNIDGGNLRTAGLVSATGNITGGNVIATTGLSAGTLSLTGNTISSTDSIITIDPASPGSTGAVIIQGNLSVTGNVTYINSNNVTTNDLTINVANNAATAAAANGGGFEVGPAGAQYASITYSSTSNTWIVSNGANVTGVVNASGNILTGGLISATGSITAGGDLSLIGNIVDTGALTISTSSNGNITLSPNGTGVIIASKDLINGQANGVGNIGSSTTYFNTVFAKATSAQYADLAENYRADADYEPGTVLEFGGDEEVTISTTDSSKRVAGVVSTNPAYLMNAGLSGKHIASVALTGRVPVKIEGPVAKGDLMVSNGNGRARACMDAVPIVGTILGKSLENFTGGEGTIEVVIGKQ